MELPEKRCPSCLDQFERDPDQRQEYLEKENVRLKGLAVRLSETVLRLVMRKKGRLIFHAATRETDRHREPNANR
jgi:hypothetical protein